MLIQGTGAVRAGIWARKPIINDSLDIGTVFPMVLWAKQRGLAVLIMNPNCSKDPITGKLIKGHTMDSHCEYLWEKLVANTLPDRPLLMVAHSAGGYCAAKIVHRFSKRKNMINPTGENFFKRAVAVAFTDSCHGGIEERLSKKGTFS